MPAHTLSRILDAVFSHVEFVGQLGYCPWVTCIIPPPGSVLSYVPFDSILAIARTIVGERLCLFGHVLVASAMIPTRAARSRLSPLGGVGVGGTVGVGDGVSVGVGDGVFVDVGGAGVGV